MQEHRPQLAWPTESRGAAGWQECVKQEARWCGSDHFFHPLRIGRNGRRSHPFQAVTSLKMDSSSVTYDFLPDCSCGAKRPTPDLRLSARLPLPSPPPTAHTAVGGAWCSPVPQITSGPHTLTARRPRSLCLSLTLTESPHTLHSAALHERIRAHHRPSVAPRLSLAPRHCCRIHPGADRGPSARARPPCCSLAPIGPSAAWPP